MPPSTSTMRPMMGTSLRSTSTGVWRFSRLSLNVPSARPNFGHRRRRRARGTRQAALRPGGDQGAQRADAAGLDRREDAAVDAAEHQHDEADDGNELAQHLDWRLAVFEAVVERAVGADEFRHQEHEQRDGDAVGEGQHDAGHDARGEQIADRDLGDDAVEDEQEARAEEHTSELQSLMRISYAVFRVKKKNKLLRTDK